MDVRKIPHTQPPPAADHIWFVVLVNEHDAAVISRHPDHSQAAYRARLHHSEHGGDVRLCVALADDPERSAKPGDPIELGSPLLQGSIREGGPQ